LAVRLEDSLNVCRVTPPAGGGLAVARLAKGVTVDVDGGAALAAGVGLTELSGPAIWHLYFELGGQLSMMRLDSYLVGTEFWPELEHDVASHALNEALRDSGFSNPVAYASEL
jgi:hypothetical protein